jgi:glucose/arabinose dehydrogenase
VLAGGERGLLGLAFHPQFALNRRLFVDYTRQPDGATVVSEFTASPDRSAVLAGSERVLMVIPQPFENHNGGMLAFGPGGRLFIGMGDGGGAGDPLELAQNPRTRLGKILRIDVNAAQPYAVPSDNPVALGGGRREIFAFGFRNPFRFSFDRLTGALYVGDVGQSEREEIDIVGLGQNYGWPRMEGDICFRPATDCFTANLRLPVATYDHANGRCSITGGYVYRGSAIPALYGTYLFADFCSGEIFGLVGNQPTVLLDTDLSIASFAETVGGELYVVDIGGGVYALGPAPI